MAKDGGYSGRIRSLAGNWGRPGYGIETTSTNATVATTAPGAQVIPANPSRVWCFVQNIGLNECYLALGTAAGGIYLYPGGSYMIDSLNPWTGEINAIATAAGNTTTLIWTEAQLAGQ